MHRPNNLGKKVHANLCKLESGFVVNRYFRQWYQLPTISVLSMTTNRRYCRRISKKSTPPGLIYFFFNFNKTAVILALNFFKLFSYRSTFFNETKKTTQTHSNAALCNNKDRYKNINYTSIKSVSIPICV